MIPGYLGEGPLDDEWFDSGDLGYFVDDELVVCGRSKDVIVVAGRNIYPEEVEAVLVTIEGVWRNNVAVFGVQRDGRERVVVMAEAQDCCDRALERILAVEASSVLDTRVSRVALIEPGSIPKTPSGKISRSGCRDLFLSTLKLPSETL